MSDTPETDKFANSHRGLATGYYQAIDLCRNLERERDEARNQVRDIVGAAESVGWNGVENSKILTQFIKDLAEDSDELRAEIELLKAKSQSDFENREREFSEMNRVLNGLRGLWKHLPNIENKYDERLAYHLDELIERLKADKELLDGLEELGCDLMTTHGKWVVMTSRCMTAAETSVRGAIQAAMKGAE